MLSRDLCPCDTKAKGGKGESCILPSQTGPHRVSRNVSEQETRSRNAQGRGVMGYCECRGSSSSVKGVCDRGPGLAGRQVSVSVPTFTPAHSATFLPRGCPRPFPPRHKCCVCPFLTECNCTEHGVCNAGLHGDGFCFCAEGWTGARCETRLGEGCSAVPWDSPAVPWDLLPQGCFPRSWVVQAAVQKYLQKEV